MEDIFGAKSGTRVPDCVIVVAGIAGLILASIGQREWFGPRFHIYRKLSSSTQYDWDQRVLNLFFQVAQTGFNCYVLFFCSATKESPMYGYNTTAHTGFLLIVAFYLYDAVLTLAHPNTSNKYVWITHHLVAAGLLTWQTSSLKTSALPASTFLISSAGHIANEAQWFRRTAGATGRWSGNALSILCNTVVLFTCVLPPPYLVHVAAEHRGMSFTDMLFHSMRWQCKAGYWAIWLPHCWLLVVQLRRTARHWHGWCPRNPKLDSNPVGLTDGTPVKAD